MSDLSTPTVPNAFDLASRTIGQERQFFLALTGHARLAAMGLEPVGGAARMLRDGGRAEALKTNEGCFVTTEFSHYRKVTWPKGAGAFAALYLTTEEDQPHLAVGAFRTKQLPGIQYWFAWSEELLQRDLASASLRDAVSPLLTDCGFSEFGTTDWRYATRRWAPGSSDGDLDWTLTAL
jgi:hypothetical protein